MAKGCALENGQYRARSAEERILGQYLLNFVLPLLFDVIIVYRTV